MSALFELELPSELNTKEPPERRGLHAEVEGSDSTNRRLWKIRFSRCGTELLDLIYRLGGVRIANLTLHTGLSSYLDDELDREHPASEEAGLHEPAASHLDLLSAFIPAERLRKAYEKAIRKRYLWHEFGDLNLVV